MAVTTTMIIVEDRLKEIFDTLPPLKNSKGIDFKPVFKCGDNKELSTFLKLSKKTRDPYPLIWLISPYTEEHKRTHVLIENMSLILAVETNSSMLNNQRLEDTFKTVLIPLYDNIKTLFMKANTVNTDDTYIVTKFYNYSGDTNPTDKHEVTDIWDAMKITFEIQINSNCLRL